MATERNPVALVTGGAGFIGAHVVRAIQAAGITVVVLDDLSGGAEDNLPEGVTFVRGSVVDHDLLARLFTAHRFRYVYHLAAYAAEGLSHFIRRFNYTNNVVGSVNVINECIRHDVECLVFTSSIAVYGAIDPPMREDSVPRPEDPYGVAKLAVEHDLEAAHRMFGLRSVIFRPHNVYGEYQNIGDPYRNVVGIFMNQIMTGRPMSVFGDGTQRRAFSYVGDIAPAIAASAWTPAAHGRIFNIGADRDYTVLELARAVAVAMGAPDHPVVHLAARNEVREAWADHSAVAQVLGPFSVTPLDEGLARMAAWVRRVGPRTGRPFEAIELTRGLPPAWAALTAGHA
ncbi:MAG: NAD-dependent epimerase/dehydratase family protein [Vicinamibacterales bacterium]